MIEHPVECGGADDAVERVNERQMQEIAGDQAHARPELCQMLARGSEHVPGEIDPYDPTTRQGFKQVGGEPASATPRVKHDFIAAQYQPRKHFLAPAYLRTGEPVINGRIPLARGLRAHTWDAGISLPSRVVGHNSDHFSNR